MKTATIFRTFKTGEVVALFPEIPGTNDPWTCLSYQHVGQHSSASVDLTDYTRPSTPDEVKLLAPELTGIGYDVRQVHRRTRSHNMARLDALK